jgi:hypothetical protein
MSRLIFTTYGYSIESLKEYFSSFLGSFPILILALQCFIQSQRYRKENIIGHICGSGGGDGMYVLS